MNIDPFFTYALNHSKKVKKMVGDRIFVPERTQAQMEADVIPYCEVHFDGATASSEDKDEMFIRPDRATVSVLCCAKERNDCVKLVEAVVDAVEDCFESGEYREVEPDSPFQINEIRCEYKEAGTDQVKPCQFQWLSFECEI